MRLHHKLSLALLPAVLLAVVGFGAWAYAAAYEALSSRALQGVGWLAERFVEEQLAARYGGEVDALGRQMRQADALAVIAGLARSGPQRVVLLDAERRVLHASGADVADRPARWGELLAGADAATGRFEEPDGRAWLYGVQRFEPWGWSVMVLEPEDDLVAAIARIRWITAWTALLTALVVVTMVLWVSREMLARPIRTLQQAAARIARDPAPVRIAIDSGDELDDLARSMEAMAAALAAEIDRREEADRQLERVKNLYAALGETNQALVRIHERSELLNALCRIAVQHGGFLLAWVGELDHATGWLVPCAVAGPAAPMVERIRVSVLGELPEGRGVTGRACRGDGWAIENDFLGNPDMAPWREAARGFGIGSAAAFGLLRGGRADRVPGGLCRRGRVLPRRPGGAAAQPRRRPLVRAVGAAPRRGPRARRARAARCRGAAALGARSERRRHLGARPGERAVGCDAALPGDARLRAKRYSLHVPGLGRTAACRGS